MKKAYGKKSCPAFLIVLISLICGLIFAAGCSERNDVFPETAFSETAFSEAAFSETASDFTPEGSEKFELAVEEDGQYSSRDEVAAYIYLYGHLPDNYITKKEAGALGWDSSAGNLWEVADGMSIGGDRFYNNEGLLPEAEGRRWYECDIGYEGGYRGAERILYSNDGLIYYTDDHYNSFIPLYDEK